MIPPHILIEIIKRNQKNSVELSPRQAKVMITILSIIFITVSGLGINMHLYYQDKKEKSEAERVLRRSEFQAYLQRSQTYKKCLEYRIDKRERGEYIDESVKCVKPQGY